MKNTIRYTFILFMIVVQTAPTEAQTYSAKIYSSVEYRNYKQRNAVMDPDLSYVNDHVKAFYSSLPILAFSVSSGKGHFHEVQLYGFNIGNSEEYAHSEDHSRFSQRVDFRYAILNVGYEFNYRLFQNKTGKWSFFAGTNVKAFFYTNKTIPRDPGYYTLSNKSISATLSLVPRVQYKLSNNWFADLHLQYALFSTYNNQHRLENPALSKTQQVNRIASSETFSPVYTARLGIGYTF